MSPKLLGALIIALPALAAAWAALRRRRPLFLFAAAMILIGTGYLIATGATDDIARTLMPSIDRIAVPVRA